jgi:hypothetical protein
VPTAIVGIYGMNFKNMPEPAWSWLSCMPVVDAGDLQYSLLLLSKGRLALAFHAASMIDSCASAHRVSLRRAALVAHWALAAALSLFAPADAAAPLTLQVATSDALPGFHLGDLPRYLALHMAEARLADWRFEPAADSGSAPDRVEWTFKLNPYAGGEVRSFARPHMAERIFAARRPITIEARLYLNGQLQTLVEKQAIIQGGPDDLDLAAAVAGVTQNLLGPQGAFRAIDSGPRPAQGTR